MQTKYSLFSSTTSKMFHFALFIHKFFLATGFNKQKQDLLQGPPGWLMSRNTCHLFSCSFSPFHLFSVPSLILLLFSFFQFFPCSFSYICLLPCFHIFSGSFSSFHLLSSSFSCCNLFDCFQLFFVSFSCSSFQFARYRKLWCQTTRMRPTYK